MKCAVPYMKLPITLNLVFFLFAICRCVRFKDIIHAIQKNLEQPI